LLTAALCIAVGYVAGSVPFGLLIARARGVDLRGAGSGNIGAANVWRVIGWPEGSATLAGDIAKGLLPVVLATRLTGSPAVAGLTGLAAIGGHTYPCFAGFRGGKGVATGGGVFLALLPLPTLLAAATWAVCLVVWRYVSLSSIAAALSFPVWAGMLQAPPILIGLSALVSVFVVWRHRANLERIVAGQEPKVDWQRWTGGSDDRSSS
jgi:glycerol-3-phosphate acyltransferase PlsY